MEGAQRPSFGHGAELGGPGRLRVDPAHGFDRPGGPGLESFLDDLRHFEPAPGGPYAHGAIVVDPSNGPLVAREPHPDVLYDGDDALVAVTSLSAGRR